MEKDDIKKKIHSLLNQASPVKPELVTPRQEDDLKNALTDAVRETLTGRNVSNASPVDQIQNALSQLEFVLCTFNSGAAGSLFLNNEDAIAGLALSLRNVCDGLKDAQYLLNTKNGRRG